MEEQKLRNLSGGLVPPKPLDQGIVHDSKKQTNIPTLNEQCVTLSSDF
jgi:hypothetical protein